MDAKITKKRLGDFLSYEWVKVLAIAVALIMLWSLLFSTTATRLTNDQVFTVINYTGTTVGTGFDKYLNLPVDGSLFSYEVYEIGAVDTETQGGTYAGVLLETRLSTGEGDVMFVADAEQPNSQWAVTDADGNPVLDEDGNPTYETDTYLRGFLNGTYYHNVLPLEDVVEGSYGLKKGLLTLIDEYLSQFYVKNSTERFDYADGINVTETERLFRERIAEMKDKRFKTEAQIQAGLQQEIVRIERYRAAMDEYLQNVADGYLAPTESKLVFSDDDGNPLVINGQFGLNLCPDEEKMPGLKEDVFYYMTSADDKQVMTAKNVNMVFLNLEGSQPEFLCEKILFVNYLVKEHKAV